MFSLLGIHDRPRECNEFAKTTTTPLGGSQKVSVTSLKLSCCVLLAIPKHTSYSTTVLISIFSLQDHADNSPFAVTDSCMLSGMGLGGRLGSSQTCPQRPMDSYKP